MIKTRADVGIRPYYGSERGKREKSLKKRSFLSGKEKILDKGEKTDKII